MIRHSDTVNSMAGASHALILRRVALETLRRARAAWKTAHATPDEKHTREAFRSCILASRALRSAAKANPKEARRMLAEAKHIDTAAETMKDRLVHIIEGGEG